MKMDLKSVIDKHIFKLPLYNIDDNEKCIINTINAHSYIEAKKDKHFEQALMSSDVLLPDGVGVVIAARILLREKIKKIAGDDIHSYLLKRAQSNCQKIFYLGSSLNTLNCIRSKINQDYPNIHVFCYSPPFKAEFTEKDSRKMINAINEVNPDVVFVGMTAPKQEKWVFDNKEEINSNMIVSIGAVFDFYSGTRKRPGPVWVKLGLEWMVRFIKEPKRLWRRNMISMPKFLFEIFKEKISEIQ